MMPFPEKKYGIIYADPPWQYKNYSRKDSCRGQEKEYDTLPLEAIKALPIQQISADDCLLFMWATFPYLQEGLDVIRAWGFHYYSLGFMWAKTYPKQTEKWFWGMGNWTRSNTEPCLLGIRGKPKRVSASIHQLIVAPVGKHSAKPRLVKDKIVALAGEVPRIELFAREKSDGWDAWGKEIT